jgi:hydroxypyruvate reductase
MTIDLQEKQARTLLRQLFDTAVASAQPALCVPPHVPTPAEVGHGRLLVIGAGKASAAMAQAVEAHWQGDPAKLEGLVVTRYGYEQPCERIEIVQAAHPVPDAAGLQAAQRLMQTVQGLKPEDWVLCLISGGGSALLSAPAPGLTLADKQTINAALLASGAPIGEMIVVRKHLSAIKGGRLAAAAYPARMLALMISDVPGDDPGDIASGPTVGHRGDATRALAALSQWGVVVPPSIKAYLEAGGDPVLPDDPRLARVENVIYAAPAQSLAAAADLARAHGYPVDILGDAIEGEAREVAAHHAKLALAAKGPRLILSGGELTVTRRGDGIGGPNAEYALALALALNGAPGIHAIACDTDGVDGAAEVAGAVIGPDTLDLARAAGVDAPAALARNDSHSFFHAIDRQIVPGPTLTNVNDFRAILIEG